MRLGIWVQRKGFFFDFVFVQVDVWDVVDRGKKRIKLEGLKIAEKENADATTANGTTVDACLDAEFLDVYQARILSNVYRY